jgi:hypothetical protein
MRRFLPIAVVIVLVALAAVALAQVGSAPAARATAVSSSGSFEVTNSDQGLPIFSATNVAPGDSTSGTVKIEDTGTEAAALTLARGDLVDSPGLGGALLSERLDLTVVDISVPGTPRSVYSGPLASMPDQDIGTLQQGEARTFEFTATLPDSGSQGFQNAVQGASTTVAYEWLAEEAGEGGGEEPGGGEEGGETPGSGGETPSGGGGETPGTTPGNGGGGGQGGTGGGSGGSGNGGQGGNPGEGGVAGQNAILNLTVPKVQRALRGGRIVVWTRCDRTCRLSVRGRLRATAAGHHRGARIRFAQKRLAAPGRQRLRIPVPRSLRRWLRQQPSPARLRARLRFVAVGTDGQRDAVRRTIRLRARHH